MSFDANDKDKKLLSKIDKLFRESKEDKDTRKEEYMEAERFYRGKHWMQSNERPVDNFIFQIIETEVPILTDSTPGTDIIAHQEDREQDAKVLETAVHYTYEQNDLTLKNSLVIRDALKTGTAFYRVGWDEDAEDGEGAVVIDVKNWRNMFIDPMATEMSKAFFAGLKEPIRIEELKRMFPKMADEIEKRRGIADEELFKNDNMESLRETKSNFRAGAGNTKTTVKDLALYEEMYLKDYSMVPIDIDETEEELEKEFEEIADGVNPDVGKFEDHVVHIEGHTAQREGIMERAKVQFALEANIPIEEFTDQDEDIMLEARPDIALSVKVIDDHLRMHTILLEDNPTSKKPKYLNNIRLVIKTGSLILFDGEPDVKISKFPYVPVYAYKDANEFWGTGEIKNLISPQKSYNEMSYAEYQGLRLSTNGGWVKDDNSGVDDEDLTNEPGLVVTKKQGTEVTRIQPGAVSTQLGNRKTSDKNTMDVISGVNEATQGIKPGGVTAARAIEALSTQAIGRMRLKSRYFELSSMKNLGELTSAFIITKWSTERMLRIYDNNGQLKTVNYDPDTVADLKYEVKMAPGSTAGIDKQALFEFYNGLAASQTITPRMMVELIPDLPGKGKILEFMQANDEKDNAIAQMQQQLEQLSVQNQQQAEILQQAGIAPEEIIPQEPQGETGTPQ